jgi:hypothetical protein
LVAVLITETELLALFVMYAFCADAAVQVSAKAMASRNWRIDYGCLMNIFEACFSRS